MTSATIAVPDPQLAAVLDRIARAIPSAVVTADSLAPLTLLRTYAQLLEEGASVSLLTSHEPTRDPEIAPGPPAGPAFPEMVEGEPLTGEILVAVVAWGKTSLPPLFRLNPALVPPDGEGRVRAWACAELQRGRKLAILTAADLSSLTTA